MYIKCPECSWSTNPIFDAMIIVDRGVVFCSCLKLDGLLFSSVFSWTVWEKVYKTWNLSKHLPTAHAPPLSCWTWPACTWTECPCPRWGWWGWLGILLLLWLFVGRTKDPHSTTVSSLLHLLTFSLSGKVSKYQRNFLNILIGCGEQVLEGKEMKVSKGKIKSKSSSSIVVKVINFIWSSLNEIVKVK